MLCPQLGEQAPGHGLVEVQASPSANFIGVALDKHVVSYAVVAARSEEPDGEEPPKPHGKTRCQLNMSHAPCESMWYETI